MSPPGTPPSEDCSAVNAGDQFEPPHDESESDFSDGYSSESSMEEHDERFNFKHPDDHDNASGDPEDEDDKSIPVIENDRLYALAEDLFDHGDNGAAAVTRADQLPPAFHDNLPLRRAYVQAFISARFHGTTTIALPIS